MSRWSSLTCGLVGLLLGCGNRPPPVTWPTSVNSSPSDARDVGRTSDMARLTLLPEQPSHKGTLRNARGDALCILPCTALVTPGSALHVDVQQDDEHERIDVPDTLIAHRGVAAGVVEPQRGSSNGAIGLGVGSAGAFMLGTLYLLACNRGGSGDPSGGTLCLGGLGFMTIGVGLLFGATIWGANSRRADIAPVRPASPGSAVRRVDEP